MIINKFKLRDEVEFIGSKKDKEGAWITTQSTGTIVGMKIDGCCLIVYYIILHGLENYEENIYEAEESAIKLLENK